MAPPGPDAPGWTIDTLHRHLIAEIQAADKRYEQRFLGQEVATQHALDAAKEAVQAALLAAKEAVLKAEIASDKRFESVNEFRQLVERLIATLISRVEAEARLSNLSERIDAQGDRLSRLEAIQAGQTGAGQQKIESRQLAQWAVGIVLVVIAAIVGHLWH